MSLSRKLLLGYYCQTEQRLQCGQGILSRWLGQRSTGNLTPTMLIHTTVAKKSKGPSPCVSVLTQHFFTSSKDTSHIGLGPNLMISELHYISNSVHSQRYQVLQCQHILLGGGGAIQSITITKNLYIRTSNSFEQNLSGTWLSDTKKIF